MQTFIEVGYYQQNKHKQGTCGDVFLTKKTPDNSRTITVLSDGLGSGVKANVLATLTASMASNYIIGDIAPERAAKIIMETLPICAKRKIGYSTFTIVDMHSNGLTRIIEHDNPPCMIIRDGKLMDFESREVFRRMKMDYNQVVYSKSFQAEPGDRIVFFSDGVSQSGIGFMNTPFGWERDKLEKYVLSIIEDTHDITCKHLSEKIVKTAIQLDGSRARDDISCACVSIREIRKAIVFTGPPYKKESDSELARIADSFKGRKIICGGTTSKILARELDLEINVDLDDLELGSHIPPCAYMDGFALVTEGTITLTEAYRILKQRKDYSKLKNAAQRLVNELLNSDDIQFVIGTKVNEAHQDPTLPEELEIRRNLIKKLCKILENSYLKQVGFRYI